MKMTDLSALPLPLWALPTVPRRLAVEQHRIRIQADWWRETLDRLELPGARPAGPTLTRAEVWVPSDDVFTLLWRTLAWGSGSHLRQNVRRLKSIQADVPAAEGRLDRGGGGVAGGPGACLRAPATGPAQQVPVLRPVLLHEVPVLRRRRGAGPPVPDPRPGGRDHPARTLRLGLTPPQRALAGRDLRAVLRPARPLGRSRPVRPRRTGVHPLHPVTCGCRAAWSACRTPPPAAPTRPA